jgi:hypothetical protein
LTSPVDVQPDRPQQVGLGGGELGQIDLVAREQADPAVLTAPGEHRNARADQRLDIAQDTALCSVRGGAGGAVRALDEVFGRTFVVTDPDGNLIRVSPID